MDLVADLDLVKVDDARPALERGLGAVGADDGKLTLVGINGRDGDGGFVSLDHLTTGHARLGKHLGALLNIGGFRAGGARGDGQERQGKQGGGGEIAEIFCFHGFGFWPDAGSTMRLNQKTRRVRYCPLVQRPQQGVGWPPFLTRENIASEDNERGQPKIHGCPVFTVFKKHFNMTMKSCLTLSGFLSLLLACGLFSTGCRLGQPASASFASVIITNQSAAKILDTTITVFREQGYHVTASGEALTFEKEGTRGDTIAYEGVINAQNGAVAMIRVRVQCVGAGPGAQRLLPGKLRGDGRR